MLFKRRRQEDKQTVKYGVGNPGAEQSSVEGGPQDGDDAGIDLGVYYIIISKS